ncbi:alpha-L RNA-binding motif-containing protein [Trichocladium antarcticum]|uniref:Small ribosomal subunit protein uS4m n=1 Tax=Trichocladium antarcticum TaxID=1450529 RepID=A0AAN6UJU1_9PEZI|nr:alpha-L RNA-binding motif-containing protein [Trichocladium antarcticum]
MKQRRLLRFHGLRRPRIRQTWNKYNLFNLDQGRTPHLSPKTFFQQKWAAKALTRGYHGEHIKERQWERMFSRRPLSAVNMDPAYMAKHNGSEQAAGRGSGLVLGKEDRYLPHNRANATDRTPYMQMVFAPMERRLDIAIFRALFASSARQARQFVIHGAVTVNGKKMTHPSYLLNPGDMFQVDIDRVMMATGKPKGKTGGKALQSSEPAEAEEDVEAETEEAATETPDAAAEAEAVDGDAAKTAIEKHRRALQDLKSHVKTLTRTADKGGRARQKQGLRKLLAEIKASLNATNKSGVRSAAEMSSVERELTSLFGQLTTESAEPATTQPTPSPSSSSSSKKQPASEPAAIPTTVLTPEQQQQNILKQDQRKILRHLVKLERENPFDLSKPYATPWQPRDYMSPFAFIPRYLEVNQRICAAVYLRHPVARPGRSEVPTPFAPTVSQLAFNWYLRRR